jgi:hypothetical protein
MTDDGCEHGVSTLRACQSPGRAGPLVSRRPLQARALHVLLTPSFSVYAAFSALIASSCFLMSPPFLFVESMIFSNWCITSADGEEARRGERERGSEKRQTSEREGVQTLGTGTVRGRTQSIEAHACMPRAWPSLAIAAGVFVRTFPRLLIRRGLVLRLELIHLVHVRLDDGERRLDRTVLRHVRSDLRTARWTHIVRRLLVALSRRHATTGAQQSGVSGMRTAYELRSMPCMPSRDLAARMLAVRRARSPLTSSPPRSSRMRSTPAMARGGRRSGVAERGSVQAKGVSW